MTKLKDLEQLLKYSQSLSNTGTWEWNIYTNETQWSEELYHIHGLKVGSEVPETEAYFHLVHPDDRDRLMEAISNAIEKSGEYKLEYRIFTKDTLQLKFIRSFGSVISDTPDQKIFIGCSQDITDQIVAERSKLESED